MGGWREKNEINAILNSVKFEVEVGVELGNNNTTTVVLISVG